MKVCYLFLLTLLLIPAALTAQLVRFKDATRQSWAGGVCCAHGTNYVVNLEVESAGNFQVDTIWIKGQPQPLTSLDLQRIYPGDSSRYFLQIRAGHTWGRMGWQNDEIIEVRKDKPAPEFEGEALVVYRLRGKQHRLEIPEIAELPYLAFP
jgi:hypothetical protein